MSKYIFIVGGVMSGVGKGVTCASLGAIFAAKGFRVTALKADPYINVDAGTMNPTEHGEVFVTDDGDETDQDMGNYERFLNVDLQSENYMTTGRVYLEVIRKERNLEYKGKNVQVVPDVPLEIIRRITTAAKKHSAEITIIEIGGTVGEYENILFLEAARMMKNKNQDDVAVVIVSYLPVPDHLGEMKTKPTQHAVRSLNSAGINPNMIIARGRLPLDKPRREKLAINCGVAPDRCISAPDVASIYEIPLVLEADDAGNKLLKDLHLKPRKTELKPWQDFVHAIKNAKHEVKIAVVGKYFGTGDFTLADAYHSVIEAVKHASWANNVKPAMTWIDSESYETDPKKVTELAEYDGLIVPGGFGTRGIVGILRAIKYARENNMPYLGLCYGMQLATVEFVRHILGKGKANTVEIDPKTPDPVIHVNHRQAKNIEQNHFGGTMRLGAYDCTLTQGTKTYAAYGKEKISERHRHRYEFNNDYRAAVEKAGLMIAGVNKETDLVEIIELKDHPFFIGVQFHPEFKSRPMSPHPLFREFIAAAIKKGKKK